VILGVGVDLVEVPRMRRILDRPWGRRFIERVFFPEEIVACDRAARPSEAYAARFAAKEAVAKALGTGFSKGITPAAIVVCGGERTRPTIRLQAKALVLAESMNVSSIHVSLTHTAGSACAVAVIEKK
jgi:holo-[acyl-carrier protein] synthase